MKISFILGAGASCDFGLPTGAELKEDILSHIGNRGNAVTEFYQTLSQAGNSREDVDMFADYLEHAQRDTIDQFIAAHKRQPKLQRIGRQAIALAIARRETKAKLFRNDYHWYRRLLDFLRNHERLVNRETFTFFTFNYDRSLEHYLRKSLISGGNNLTEEQVTAFFEDNFIHIHGVAGHLPWQGTDRETVHREYGGHISPDQLSRIANQIITPEQEVTLGGAHLERLIKADLVVIMGFGFAPSNKSRIHFDELVNNNVRIKASTHNRDDLYEALKGLPSVEPDRLDCNNFIAKFIREFDEKGFG